MTLRLLGQRNTTGIGRHYNGFCDAIRHRYQTVEIDGFSGACVAKASVSSTDSDINLSFVAIDYRQHLRGHHIQWTVFETTRIPDQVRSVLDEADTIWVPSGWGRDILVANGYDPDVIAIVPEGVDSQWRLGARIMPNQKLRFLCVGKYETRKGIDDLVVAWRESYANDPDMELVIKTWAWRDSEQRYQELVASIQGMSNVTVLWGYATDQHMLELYHSADVFILPTRGEGWGLPIIEAAACGLPIITIPFSGHMEYLHTIETSVVPISYDLCPAQDRDLEFFYPRPDRDWGSWAVPRDGAIVQAMDRSRRDIQMLRHNAHINGKIIQNQFGWAQSVDKALAVLHQGDLI